MKLKKLISMILVISFLNLVTITQSLASEIGLFFPEPVAKQLYIDIKYCNDNLKNEKDKVEILEKNNKLLLQKDELNIKKIDLLVKDKEILQKESDNFKDLYVKTNDEKLKILADQPSRINWFTYGGITAAIIFIAGFFAIK